MTPNPTSEAIVDWADAEALRIRQAATADETEAAVFGSRLHILGAILVGEAAAFQAYVERADDARFEAIVAKHIELAVKGVRIKAVDMRTATAKAMKGGS